jgi:hypothetical protein
MSLAERTPVLVQGRMHLHSARYFLEQASGHPGIAERRSHMLIETSAKPCRKVAAKSEPNKQFQNLSEPDKQIKLFCRSNEQIHVFGSICSVTILRITVEMLAAELVPTPL